MVHQRDAQQPVVLNGKRLRLLRFIRRRYAVCTSDVAAYMRISKWQARRYINWLYQAGLVYQRYRQNNFVYYSSRRRA